MLVFADLVLALAAAPWQVFLGTGLWGLHMGLTQGLFNKLVVDSSPADLRGSAFGIFNLVSGLALLLASVVAGSLGTHWPICYFHHWRPGYWHVRKALVRVSFWSLVTDRRLALVT